MATMKAVVLYAPGPPSALKIELRPIPKAAHGQVLIRIHAFGLNRSELFTRLGHSPNVRLPRVLGIEAVGTVAECPGEEHAVGETVATCMGGLGREVDGGYAEYTLVKTKLPWDVLGALPEMLQTSWGALNAERGLQIVAGETLLIRGGTTSVGLAAAAISKSQGLTVLATTRRKDRIELLKAHGADHVAVDDGHIEAEVKQVCPGGVDKVLELVGSTLMDSCRCVKEGGRVCQVGVVGGNSNANPEEVLPKGATYGFYGGEQEDFHAMPLQAMVDQVGEGKLVVQIGKKFNIDEIVEAHRVMEENTAGGKIVVLT
jgi:NADPH:quinone reductase-like Zn-dependent oxidoreductase